MEHCGISRTEALLNAAAVANAGQAEKAMGYARERAETRRPIQYIFGETWFFGRRFAVDGRCLIPRPDTEVLCERAADVINAISDPRVLDMCTGSGCIAVTLALECGCHVDAADISEDALDVARGNIGCYGADVTLYRGDMFCAVGDRMYDVIVCNPPYIDPGDAGELEPEVTEYEPRQALYAEGRGLYFYRRLAAEAGAHLVQGGTLLMEIGSEQGEAVSRIMAEGGFSRVSVTKDYGGNDRVVTAVWNL